MKIDLSLDIIKGLNNLKISNDNLMIHSDQRFHYTSPMYYKQLEQSGFTQSMSRKGNCLDNAPMESFFGHMKDEIEYKACRTINEIKYVIDKYMLYYNQ